jgi:hypothetical protein
MAKQPPSRYAQRRSREPSPFWRPAVAVENIRLAGSPTAGRYVPKSIPKGKARSNTVSISTTAMRTKRNLELHGEALGPRQAAKRRQEDTFGYVDERRREQARKQHNAALRKLAERYLAVHGEAEAARARTLQADMVNHRGKPSEPGRYVRTHYLELMVKRTVRGEELEAGEWHGLMDLLRGLNGNHPLARIVANSGTIKDGGVTTVEADAA